MVAESSVELRPAVVWKVEFVKTLIGHLTEETAK